MYQSRGEGAAKKPDHDLIAAYREMSTDRVREAEAHDWADELIEDAVLVPRGRVECFLSASPDQLLRWW